MPFIEMRRLGFRELVFCPRSHCKARSQDPTPGLSASKVRGPSLVLAEGFQSPHSPLHPSPLLISHPTLRSCWIKRKEGGRPAVSVTTGHTGWTDVKGRPHSLGMECGSTGLEIHSRYPWHTLTFPNREEKPPRLSMKTTS